MVLAVGKSILWKPSLTSPVLQLMVGTWVSKLYGSPAHQPFSEIKSYGDTVPICLCFTHDHFCAGGVESGGGDRDGMDCPACSVPHLAFQEDLLTSGLEG